jgi:hypothetical protein
MAWNLDTVYVGKPTTHGRPERDTPMPDLGLRTAVPSQAQYLVCSDCGTTFTTHGAQSHGTRPCWACVRQRAAAVKAERRTAKPQARG